MRSSERRPARRAARASLALFAALAASAVAPRARADTPIQPFGFAAERLYTSASGSGWLVMDDLALRGGLGGAISVSAGYAHAPVRVATNDGARRLTLVRDDAFAAISAAITYHRFRFYVDMSKPLVVAGDSGNVGNYQLTGPSIDAGNAPDTISDVRLGFDARLLGEADGAFRLGAGAQLWVPSGNRADYDTDGTFRAMGRVLFAGDVGALTYAGHVGVHVRPLDDTPEPGSPRGSEILFGAAAGAKLPLEALGAAVVVGPEVFGASAFAAPFARETTALEALLTGRVEQARDDGPQLRLKLGMGGGLNAHFGAPEWRGVIAFEVLDRRLDPIERKAGK